MKNNLYIWGEIVWGNCQMKGEVPTLSHFLFWYIILINGTMKTINLTQGQVALVDDGNYDFLMQWKWIAHKGRGTSYAERSEKQNGKFTIIKMHRVIMNTPIMMEVDHIDHNGLNCQKQNLRNCTHKQNMINQKPRGVSKFRGVSWNQRMNKWKGYISNPHTHLGYFDAEEDAAKKYDEVARIRFGEFANLNFKEP
jgi:hypothetical protein